MAIGRLVGVVLMMLVLAPGAGAAPPRIEYWMGLMATGESSTPELTFVVTFRRAAADQPWTGTLDIPRAPGISGAIDVRLKDVVYAEREIKFVSPPPPAENTYELTREPGSDKASGRLMVGGQQIVLIKMWRASEAQALSAIAHRPQNPREPLPYTQRDVTFTNPSGGTTLAGTLAIPGKDSGATPPFGAVVLLSDSGPQNRDGAAGTHKPLLVWADQLARRGILVLRTDDRGVGGSSGSYYNATMDDLAGDARAAAEFLKAQPEVDPRRVGLIGMGEGATVAARASAASKEAGELRLIALLTPSGMRGADLMALSERRKMEVMGEQPAFVERRMQSLGPALDLIAKGADEAAISEALKSELLAYSQAQRAGGAIDDWQLGQLVRQRFAELTTAHMRSWLQEDGATALGAVRCDVMAILAENDLIVPARENMDAVAAALNKAIDRHEIGEAGSMIYPGVNHWLQPSSTGFEDEYDQQETTVSPAVLKRVIDWVALKMGMGGR